MKLYRGYNKDYPNWGTRENQNHIWATDEIEYAMYYANLFDNGGIVEFDIDDDKMNCADEYDCENMLEDWDDFGGIIDADNEMCQTLMDNGFNCAYMDNGNQDIFLILDKSLIKSAKELSLSDYDNQINEVLRLAGVQLDESNLWINDKILYHGTNKKFDKFIPSEKGTFGKGIYLTPNYNTALFYGNKLLKVKVNLKNPIYLTHETDDSIKNLIMYNNIDKLKDMGYDGIIIGDEDYCSEVVAWNPEDVEIIK